MIATMLISGLLASVAAAPQAGGEGMTVDQASAMMRDRLMQNDKDGDGRLSKAEFEAMVAARGGRAARFGSRMFGRLDADRNGVLSSDELTRMTGMQIKRLDGDGDGFISREEGQAARSTRGGGRE